MPRCLRSSNEKQPQYCNDQELKKYGNKQDAELISLAQWL